MTTADWPFDAPPEELEVDGVRVLRASSPGLVRAGLMFRVGQADEHFTNRGVTHLVEHLALAPLGEPAHGMNGTVDLVKTTFYTQGTPDDVTSFLATVTANLADLPTDRLEMESRILRTEEAGRANSAAAALYNFRFGARAHGLTSLREYGLERLTADEVREWAATRFTADNAVLWIAGDLPDGLKLRLPRGSRFDPPPLDPLPYEYPAWGRAGGHGAVVGMLLAKDRGPGTFMALLERRARQHLRHEHGLSYSVLTTHDRLTADTWHSAIWADGLPDHLPAVAEGLTDTLKQLAAEPVDPEELDKQAERFALYAALPEGVVPWLDASAEERLIGGTVRSRGEQVGTAFTITPDDVLAQAQAALASSLVVVPPELDIPGDWSTLIPEFSDAVLQGEIHRPVLRPGETTESRGVLITSDEGVSLVFSPDRRVTVRYDEVAGLLAWEDGGRAVFGNDGFVVSVHPKSWAGGDAAVAQIDGAVDPSLVVPMGMPPNAEEEATAGPRLPLPYLPDVVDKAVALAQRHVSKTALWVIAGLGAFIAAGVRAYGYFVMVAAVLVLDVVRRRLVKY